MARAKDIDISIGEYYHLYTRGVEKKKIFLDDRDYVRFLFCMFHFQYKEDFHKIGKSVTDFLSFGSFEFKRRGAPEEKNREVEIVSFVLMPNHVHLIALELKPGGIARMMQRTLGGYAKYFNTKYKISGHLFQGAYNAVHINNNDQLLYASTYLHRNPRELRGWKDKEDQYVWSSFSDFIDTNRWGKLLKPEIVLEQFPTNSAYHKFVNTSPAKDRFFYELHDF